MQEHKRIGILTYHYAINDGAVLQAYALLQALNRYIDVEAEIVDYRPLSSELKKIKESIISKKLNTIPSKINRYFKFSSFVKDKLELSYKKFISDDYKAVHEYLNQNYDAVVTGSDEIWKIENGKFARPFPNIYWLPFGSRFKRIAFAASANKLQYKNLTAAQKAWIKESLEGFDLLGIRDNHTLEFLEYIGIPDRSKISIVPDPTFIFDPPDNNTIEQSLRKYGVVFKKPLAAVLLTDKEINKTVCDYLKSQGYQVIALSYYNKYADVNLYGKLDPQEWALAFAYFDVCVTDRFHGIVFSLKNKIPVIAIDDIFDYGEYESKNACLMKEFGLLDYYSDIKKDGFDSRKFEQMFKQAIRQVSSGQVNERLEKNRANCFYFIKQIGKIVKGNVENEEFVEQITCHA